MKHTINILLIAIVAFIFAYLITAFVQAEINFSCWGIGARFLTVVSFIVCCMIGFGIYDSNCSYDEHDKR